MSLLSSLSVLQAGSQLLAGIVKAKLEGEATDFAARRYLMDTLSKLGPGLPAKAAQILNSGHEQGPLDLTSLLMKDSEVKDRISMQSPRLAEMIETLSFNALPGSLGQVHKAQLKDGRFVAIKIQYPGIDTKIHSQLATLLGATRFASQVKLQNFDHHGYLNFFGEKLAEELDYVREGSNQLRFRNRLLKQIQYKVPAYYSEYSSSSILVQEWVDCSSLQSQNLFPNEIRQKLAQHLLSLFLQQVFEFNELHGDLHFGNVGVSTLESHPLVLLDFGSTISLQKSHVAAIKEVVECIRKGNSFDALDTFCQLGFTRSALLPMASSLNDLLILFLRPLSSPTPFDPGQWNFREASAEILGSHRMQFRMAGPPWFLMFMKTVSGLVNCLKSLSSTIDISIVHDHFQDFSHSYKKPSHIDNSTELDHSSAKYLCVKVLEGSIEKVLIQMPAKSIVNLEDLIPDEAKMRLSYLGYNFIELKNRIVDSGASPQTIFSEQIGDLKISVWLE